MLVNQSASETSPLSSSSPGSSTSNNATWPDCSAVAAIRPRVPLVATLITVPLGIGRFKLFSGSHAAAVNSELTTDQSTAMMWELVGTSNPASCKCSV